MEIEELQEIIAEDSIVNDDKIDKESLKISSLHSKYYRFYARELSQLSHLKFEYNKLKKKRTEYYLGRASDEEYVAEPLNQKILKTDIDLYLNADEVLNESFATMDKQKIKVEMIEKFISTLTARGFNLRTALDFIKFKNAEY